MTVVSVLNPLSNRPMIRFGRGRSGMKVFITSMIVQIRMRVFRVGRKMLVLFTFVPVYVLSLML